MVAMALGFWHDTTSAQQPVLDAKGLVEVPRWRHALINIAHPLLRQGLVILDTPGLNAIGAEPELTVSLIPQAQAVAFILAADTGVTQSDLSIWREHLVQDDRDMSTRLVVLNKIDTLWDALDSPQQVAMQIESQRQSTAEILGVPPAQVVAVSAQKGLLAKVNHDPALLERSCLAQLEEALSRDIMGRRQKILAQAVRTGIADLRIETSRVIGMRRRDLTEQLAELRSLKGKNTPVIRTMRSRIAQEQTEFDAGGARIHAVRSVHIKLLRDIFSLLGPVKLKHEMAALSKALQQSGLKLGVKRVYGDTFDGLRANMALVHAKSLEIHAMFVATFLQLNTDYGFSLQAPEEPEVSAYQRDLDLVELGHVQYLGLGNVFRLAQPAFAQRLVRALSTRLRGVHEAALSDIEAWSKSAAAQLDTQLRERRKNFVRRLEAIDRISQASSGLEERITEIDGRGDELDLLEGKLREFTDQLTQMTAPQRFALMADAVSA